MCPDNSVIEICNWDHSRNDPKICSVRVLRGCLGTSGTDLGRVDKGGGLPHELAACPSFAGSLRADSSRTANGDGLPRELEGRRLLSSRKPQCSTISLLSTIKSRSHRICFCVGKSVRNMSQAHPKISLFVNSRPGALSTR